MLGERRYYTQVYPLSINVAANVINVREPHDVVFVAISANHSRPHRAHIQGDGKQKPIKILCEMGWTISDIAFGSAWTILLNMTGCTILLDAQVSSTLEDAKSLSGVTITLQKIWRESYQE